MDCIVVGSGHTGSCAALSASEPGCTKGKDSIDCFTRPLIRLHRPPVLLVGKCLVEWVGGNGYFTASGRIIFNTEFGYSWGPLPWLRPPEACVLFA